MLLSSGYYDRLFVKWYEVSISDDNTADFVARCNRENHLDIINDLSKEMESPLTHMAHVVSEVNVTLNKVILPTDAENERLDILVEEMGEVICAISAIRRFGFEGRNPELLLSSTNREDLTRELGDVTNAINMLTEANDVDAIAVIERADAKSENIGKWLRYN